MRAVEFLSEYDSAAAAQQAQQAFAKTRQRQEFYGRTPLDLKGDPEEIGDTWDDYKSYVKTFGQRPKNKLQPETPIDDKAVPLDPEKLRKPKFTPGLSDPFDTEPDLGTVG
jgi:hypothetical protein